MNFAEILSTNLILNIPSFDYSVSAMYSYKTFIIFPFKGNSLKFESVLKSFFFSL